MSQWLTNHTEIARRGGVVSTDDDFEVVACSACGAQYLYNEETLDLYVDLCDLGKKHLDIEGADLPACRGCGLKEWDFVALDVASPEVEGGPWAWAR